MDNFTHWFTYYDSVFLKTPPNLPASFFQGVHFKSVIKKKWPEYASLPELPHLLADLQAFFVANLWKKCNLSREEAEKLEENLNKLMMLIQVEKMYAQQFWTNSKRRVQAAFLHYFVIIKHTFISLIPETCSSLSDSISQKKCCLQMKHVEKLINHFLHHLPPVYNFLQDDFFQEEISLIAEMFQQITYFCQNLPKLNRSDLQQIPKLMKYICLNNSLESISKNTIDMSLQSPTYHPRKKAVSIQSKEKKIKVHQEISQYQGVSNQSRNVSGQKFDMENKSGIHLDKNDKTIKDAPTLFKFPKPIFRQKRNLDTSSPETSINLSRMDNSQTKKGQDRMRSTTTHPLANNSVSFSSKKLDSRETIYTDRERLFTRTTSIGQDERYKNNPIHFAEDQEQERKNHNKKPKPIKLNKPVCISQQVEMQTGKSRGWAVIREHIFKKVAQRKMRRLLFS